MNLKLDKNTTTTTTTVGLDITTAIAELVQVRAEKAELAKRESAIRAEVIKVCGKEAQAIADPTTGVVIAELVESERRSVSDWDEFAVSYPEAYEALVKFTKVTTLLTK